MSTITSVQIARRIHPDKNPDRITSETPLGLKSIRLRVIVFRIILRGERMVEHNKQLNFFLRAFTTEKKESGVDQNRRDE